MPAKNTRIFITGIGAVTPVGNTRQQFWDSVVQGRSGIGPITILETGDLPVKVGGEIRDLDSTIAEVNDKVSVRKMDRATLFSVVAAREALTDAWLPAENLGERVSVVIGSGLSGLSTLQEQTERLLTKGPGRVSPFTIPLLMPNAAPANISLAFGATGTCYTSSSACSSSGHAMIDAYELLQRGESDIVITGGTEASLTRLAISAFANMGAMTKKFNDTPQVGMRPFDAERDGFIMSEGSVILILETAESVKARGVTPYAEFVGYGATSDSHHLVQPDLSAVGATRAMRQAMKMAGWNPEDIADQTYVNAHGTSTPYNDLMETTGLKAAFGDHVRKLQISSTKSTTGHMIGAACAAEMAACALALRDGVLPPTINYTTPDPECDLDYIPNTARQFAARYALNNSFGFGGHNVCLAIQRMGERR